MFVVDDIFSSKYEVKKSTFTSYLLPYSLFADYHDRVKAQHPKASHIVWAFRTLNEHHQIVEGGSDDGEPKGVAATPTLNVLRGEELINTAILTVRYFGGTKLGTGGMVRAYTQSAKEVVQESSLQTYIPKKSFSFETSYSLVNRYEHYLKSQNILYHDREFLADKVRWNISLSEQERQDFDAFIRSL